MPVDGLGTVGVDVDQPGTTTKPVKVVAVAYVPRLPRNLLSTREGVKQWGKPLVYYQTKTVLGFPKEESLVFNFCPHKRLFSATGLIQSPSQGAALALAVKTVAEAMTIETKGQWGPCAGVRPSPSQGEALAVVKKVRDIMEAHRMLAHPSAEITQKTGQAMRIATTGQWGFCEARLQVKAKRQTVQWINRPDKTGSGGVGNKDLGVKPGKDESVEKIGALQLEVQDVESEQQPASQERKQEIQEATPDPEERTQEAWRIPKGGHRRYCRIPRRRHGRRFRIPRKYTRGAVGSRGGDTRGAIGSRGRDARGAIGSQGRDAGSAIRFRGGDTGGAVGSRGDTGNAIGFRGGDKGRSRADNTVDGFGRAGRTRASETHHQRHLPPNNTIAHVESTVARRCGRTSVKEVSADDRRSRRGRRRGECVGMRRRGLDHFSEEGGDNGNDSGGRVTGTKNRQQAMESFEMEEWRKARRKKEMQDDSTE